MTGSHAAATADGQAVDGDGSDFARLARRIRQAGLLDRRPGHYAVRSALVAALFAACWAAFAALGDSWWQMLLAVAMAAVFAQVGFLAHDLGHRQVFRGRRLSQAAGLLVGDLLIGMSYGWWVDKHTRHHIHPNHERYDPDVSPAVIVWSARQAAVATGLPRFVCRYQASLFFPVLLLEGLHLHVAGVRRLLRRPHLRHRLLEAVLLAVHVVLYLGAVCTVLPAGKAAAFVLVHQAAFGLYLGCTFAPNHKGMLTRTGEDGLDFLRRQVLTSRNIRGGRLLDVLYGGLNHQIEHHLFPSMPAPNLRRARPIVRAYCAEIGVPYEETGLLASYGRILRHLHAVGAGLRRPERTGA